jgi:hypothetical protein
MAPNLPSASIPGYPVILTKPSGKPPPVPGRRRNRNDELRGVEVSEVDQKIAELAGFHVDRALRGSPRARNISWLNSAVSRVSPLIAHWIASFVQLQQ